MSSAQIPLQGDPSQDDAFQRELTWCIEQLEIGLLASKSKLPTSQTHEAVRILKVLRNPKAPYVKKRQYMRAMFGDYRKKMDDETKRYAAKTKKISVKAASAKSQKCTFIKKSSSLKQDPDHIEGSSSGFIFNFDVDPDSEGEGSRPVADETIASEKPIPESILKISPSNNSFRFNFDDRS